VILQNQMKNIIIVVAVIILFVGLAIYAKPGNTDNTKNIKVEESTSEENFHPAKNEKDVLKNTETTLTAPEIFYDFGTIKMKNGKVSHLFKVVNDSSEKLNSILPKSVRPKIFVR